MTMATDVRAVAITGASTGIGRARALHLARRGWQVFAGVRKERDAESLRSESVPSLRPLMIDVTDRASIERAEAEVRAVLDGRGLDGLVNNAGVGVAVPVEYVRLDGPAQTSRSRPWATWIEPSPTCLPRGLHVTAPCCERLRSARIGARRPALPPTRSEGRWSTH
jgi:NAD(P)-dependent dehydrogenase (short-subunit alcohol dehydrogenase family)